MSGSLRYLRFLWGSGKTAPWGALVLYFLLAPFLSHVDSEGSVFRSNHASNYISLGGTLNEDRDSMLRQIERAMRQRQYKPEGFRGL